jgi:hypothetical protein
MQGSTDTVQPARSRMRANLWTWNCFG